MPYFNKKLIGGTRYRAGPPTYVTPTGQEVVSTPSSTSSVPVHTVYSKTGTPTYYVSPCNNCKSVSPPVKNETPTGLTTDDYILIGIGILVVIVVIGVMVI